MTSTAASRLRSLLHGTSSNRRLLLHRFASSYSSSSRMPEAPAESPRNRTANVFEDQSDGGGCAAYNHAVRYAPPSTIKLHQQRAHLQNSVSLIGTVERPPTSYNKPSDWEGDVGVYLILRVKSSPRSSLRVMVEMWGEIAQVALEHVKTGDYIYVSGSLESYRKRGLSQNDRSEYKVKVKELNFVKQHNEKPKSHEVEAQVRQPEPQGESSGKKTEEDRLHLWQVFFSNPMEWYDNRQNKISARTPDFKHKSTGEALWMKADDPPWIKKQLQLYDTMVASGCFNDSKTSRHSNLSSYMSDDLV